MPVFVRIVYDLNSEILSKFFVSLPRRFHSQDCLSIKRRPPSNVFLHPYDLFMTYKTCRLLTRTHYTRAAASAPIKSSFINTLVYFQMITETNTALGLRVESLIYWTAYCDRVSGIDYYVVERNYDVQNEIFTRRRGRTQVTPSSAVWK